MAGLLSLMSFSFLSSYKISSSLLLEVSDFFRFAYLGLDRWLSFACQVSFYSLLLGVDITTSSSTRVWDRKHVFSVLMQGTILIFSLCLMFLYMYIVVWHCHFWRIFIGITVGKMEAMATHSSVLPGESQGRRSLVGCRLWGRTELDTTEVT